MFGNSKENHFFHEKCKNKKSNIITINYKFTYLKIILSLYNEEK